MSRRDYYPENQPVPPLDIPEAGQYLWDWYFDASDRVRRITEGICGPIPPSEWLAWAELTQNIVYPFEYGILSTMDVAFCAEMNKELEAQRAENAPKPPPQGKPSR